MVPARRRRGRGSCARWGPSPPGVAADLPEERLDASRVLHRPVGPEVELGRDPQIQMLPEPVADEATGADEGRQGSGPLGLVAEDRHEDLGGSQVACGLDFGHRHESEPRVLELPLQERRDLLLDELIDPVQPLALHQRISTEVSSTRPATLSSMKSIALAMTSLACRASAET